MWVKHSMIIMLTGVLGLCCLIMSCVLYVLQCLLWNNYSVIMVSVTNLIDAYCIVLTSVDTVSICTM